MAADHHAGLPEILEQKIVSNLPARSVKHCARVSKQWRSFMTNPEFITCHLQSQISKPNKPFLFVVRRRKSEDLPFVWDYHGNEPISKRSLIPLPNPKIGTIQRVIGHCNGLICFTTPKAVLWNPVTGCYLRLKKRNPIAFFLDSMSNSKVLFSSRKVYDLANETWSTISKSKSKHVKKVRDITSLSMPIVFRDRLHWKTDESSDHNDENSCIIMTFHVDKEFFQVLDLPWGEEEINCYETKRVSIGVVDNRLALFDHDDEGGPETCQVWVMKEYGVVESWTKVYTIEFGGSIRWVTSLRNNETTSSTKLQACVTCRDDYVSRKKRELRRLKLVSIDLNDLKYQDHKVDDPGGTPNTSLDSNDLKNQQDSKATSKTSLDFLVDHGTIFGAHPRGHIGCDIIDQNYMESFALPCRPPVKTYNYYRWNSR